MFTIYGGILNIKENWCTVNNSNKATDSVHAPIKDG
jgi:hypothetical protein